MSHRLPIPILLTLVACGDAIGPDQTASHGTVEPGEMVALSREAVEDSAVSEAVVDETPTVAMSTDMLSDAVPLSASIAGTLSTT